MLVLAAASAGSAKAAELDGELLALCRESGDLSAELSRPNAATDLPWLEREAHPARILELAQAARLCELRELITDMPARTPEGIQAKARVVLAEFEGDDEWEEYPGQYDPSGALALSLARDVLGGDGVMARRKSTAGTTHVGDALPPPPPMPAKTPEEIAKSREICRKIQELTLIVVQNNLDTAVLLAQMAAQHRGPLVDHFAELGRRYAHTLREPPQKRHGLRVIQGGAD